MRYLYIYAPNLFVYTHSSFFFWGFHNGKEGKLALEIPCNQKLVCIGRGFSFLLNSFFSFSFLRFENIFELQKPTTKSINKIYLQTKVLDAVSKEI